MHAGPEFVHSWVEIFWSITLVAEGKSKILLSEIKRKHQRYKSSRDMKVKKYITRFCVI